MGTFNLGLFRPFRSPGSALSLDGRMFSRQAPRQFSVFSLSYKERRAETQLRILSVTCVFVGGVLFFRFAAKRESTKPHNN